MPNSAFGIAHRSRLALATGGVLMLVGALMAYGGSVLISLGGSLYYLPTGIGLLTSGALLILQRPLGVWLYAIIYTVTLVWAVEEVGFHFWTLSPRVVAPTVLAVPVLLSLVFMGQRQSQFLAKRATAEGGQQGTHAIRQVPTPMKFGYFGAAVMTLLLVAFGIAAMYPHGAIYGEGRSVVAPVETATGAGDWTAYGRTNEGRRFAPFTAINKQNVDRLQVAWTAHTGEVPEGSAADENTPLQIGDKLITCSPHNIIHALDVETGKVLWSFDPHVKSLYWQRCRSVGYFKAPTEAEPKRTATAETPCVGRVVMTTVDSRLIELDLRTGRRCIGFGKAGIVDLLAGLGNVPTNYYSPTSGPTVAGGLIVIGSAVPDSLNIDMPSGVVRAFDARTGSIRWVWDLGNVKNPNALPAKGSVFTRGTPNVWASPSVDEKLGLVFLPTGNPSPDHWGGNRTPAGEKYGSSVVALNLATGEKRWSFQTTHHDLWDYDVASQPTLYDIPDGRGGRLPALIQPTKRGEIFVLDRRTGIPITSVVERTVPGRSAIRGDWTSPIQPYSIGMPTISTPRIKESDMWGFSPLDQLWCRIEFKRLRYEGDFTPPSTRPGLLFPGVFGGMNWGGASVDEVNDYLIVNDIRIADSLALVQRAEADRDGTKVLERLSSRDVSPGHGGLLPQTGAPYAAMYSKFMSPLEVPCNAPPYGTLTAIDLKTKKVAWQVPMGTTRDTGPFGLKMYLPMPIGLPTIGGSLVTKSGLIFFAGTQDFFLRAIDSSTGREVWKSRLPVGAGATPMTYISPASKRQFIVISASGARNSPVKSDLIIAYAVPR